MTITLPLATILEPSFRILVKPTYRSNWTPFPTQQLHGAFQIDEFWRSCIPEPGQLTFHFDYGNIDGKYYGSSSSLDLYGQMVRLQVSPYGAGAWRTVWVGVCEYQEDRFYQASAQGQSSGTRIYHCQDLAASILKRQPLDHHGTYINGTASAYIFGHPGYNGMGWDGRIFGNLDSSGVTFNSAGNATPWSAGDNLDLTKAGNQNQFRQRQRMHTMPGAGVAWTDQQVCDHAMAVTRVPYSPWFFMSGATALLSSANAWDVPTGTTAWDLLVRVLDRRRGRGVAFLDWDDDTSNPTGELNTYITVAPQTYNDVTSAPPTDDSAAGFTPTTFPGALTAGTTVSVDLSGDHRGITSTLQIGDRYQSAYDYVESLGEPIEVLATICIPEGSLETRWNVEEETAFTNAYATDPRKVMIGRYDPVWQLFGLTSTWAGVVGDGNSGLGTTWARCDYRCTDSGLVLMPGQASPAFADTSMAVAKVLGDLPLYVGYDYSQNPPARFDGQPEQLAPQRRPPFVLLRDQSGSTDRYWRAEQDFGFDLRVSEYGIMVSHGSDTTNGVRFLAGPTKTFGSPIYDKTAVVITCGIRLPHRARMGAGNGAATASTALRKRTLVFRGLHLWLAAPGAIYDISDQAYDANGWGGRRNAAGASAATPGFLRDDRDKLAQYHALACAWYLTPRRTASWQLRDCGFLPSFAIQQSNGQTGSQTYPKMGQLVTTLIAGGGSYSLQTPVTKIHYTNANNGVTTWITDWSDLDLRSDR